MRELLILGCGHSESLTHFNTNAAIRERGRLFLIDAGWTIKPALAAQGHGFADVDGIFITHVHGDHVFGLERIGYESRFGLNRRIPLHLLPALEDELWTHTLQGSMGGNSEGAQQLGDYFDVHYVTRERLCTPQVNAQLIETHHTPGKLCRGLLLEDRVLFTSDTRPIPGLADLDFTIGFHDVTFQNGNPVHASLEELLDVYPASLRKRLYLMSYDDHYAQFEDRVNAEFAGLARQGMTVPL